MRIDRLALAACALLTSCSVLDPGIARQSGDLTESRDRQILVMLREAPQHFRPNESYAGGYASGSGRQAVRRVAERLARDYRLAVVDDWSMPAIGLDCFLMRLRNDETATEEVVGRLAVDSRVESVQLLHVFHVLGSGGSLYALQPAARVWHLDEMHRFATGRGVRVAVIDTGVDTAHPDLRGRIAIGRNFVDGSTMIGEAHGTAVAGIIAARADDHPGTVGIAPEAILLALRACREVDDRLAARCTSFTLAKALQFAIEQKVQVINLSLGGPRDRLLGRLIDAAMAHGAVVVAAIDPRERNGGFPASHAGVLAVDVEARRAAPDTGLHAPGRDIPAPLPGGRWGFVSGASFAAAEVTGVVALLRQLAPALGPGEARATLAPRATAEGGYPPIIDAYGAVERAAGACACVTMRDAASSAIR